MVERISKIVLALHVLTVLGDSGGHVSLFHLFDIIVNKSGK
jgi:hypothetical protein